MKNLHLFFLLFFPILAHSQNNAIEINLNNGKTIHTNYVFIYSGYMNSYARINGKKGDKISIDKIKSIEGKDKFGNDRHFNSIRYDGRTIWGERTFISKRIKLYSTSNFDFNLQAKSGSLYSKDNLSVRELKYNLLKQDLSDNVVALEYLKKANQLRVAQITAWTGSVALFIAGVVQMANRPLSEPGESAGIPPVFFAATGVNLIGWVLGPPKINHFREALKHYE